MGPVKAVYGNVVKGIDKILTLNHVVLLVPAGPMLRTKHAMGEGADRSKVWMREVVTEAGCATSAKRLRFRSPRLFSQDKTVSMPNLKVKVGSSYEMIAQMKIRCSAV